VPFALLLDGAGPTIRGQVGQQRRGAADHGEYREAVVDADNLSRAV
jgi:hypothetical protein